jgi:hypothetical protein
LAKKYFQFFWLIWEYPFIPLQYPGREDLGVLPDPTFFRNPLHGFPASPPAGVLTFFNGFYTLSVMDNLFMIFHQWRWVS